MPESVERTVFAVSTDLAEWIINDLTIDYLLSQKSIDQNLDADFSVTKTYDAIKKKEIDD